MGRSSTKQLAKRRMARVWSHLDDAINLLITEYGLFANIHTEHAQQIEAMAKEIIIVQSQVEDFWKEAWGELPADMRNWV